MFLMYIDYFNSKDKITYESFLQLGMTDIYVRTEIPPLPRYWL